MDLPQPPPTLRCAEHALTSSVPDSGGPVLSLSSCTLSPFQSRPVPLPVLLTRHPLHAVDSIASGDQRK